MFGRYEDYVGYLAGEYADYSLAVRDCRNYGVIDGSETNGTGAGGGISSCVFLNGSKNTPAKTSVEILRCFNYGDILEEYRRACFVAVGQRSYAQKYPGVRR